MKSGKKQVPHVFVILLALMFLALVATWIIPSGSYNRVLNEASGRQVVDPDSFKLAESKKYLTPWDYIKVITDGMTNSALVGFSVMLIGGSWAVINSTEAIGSAVKNLSKKFKGKEHMMFPVIMFVFAFIAAIIGGGELNIVYLPAILPICIELGFDCLTAVAAVEVGAVTAFMVSVYNPFTVALGQQIYGIELYSGSWYRIILQVIFFAVGSWWVVRYASKVKADPSISICKEETEELRAELFANKGNDEEKKETCSAGARRTIGIVLLAILALLVVGVVKWDWYLNEINGMFIAAAAFSAIIAKINLNDACKAFSKGASDVASAALICGLSNAIATILTNGGVIDVVIHGLANVLTILPKALALVGIYLVQWIFNFLVNSGSGQFMITMPILAPLGDLAGLAPNAVILASEMGDGLTNMFFPTAGVLLACLGIAKVPYQKWVKFIAPYIGLMTVLDCIALIIAQVIGYV